MSTGKVRSFEGAESAGDVDAVLRRMVDAIGGDADDVPGALGVPAQTIKTWRRRGEVPMKHLQKFAAEKGLGLDMLMTGRLVYPTATPGAEVGARDSAEGGFELSPRELALLRNYRAADPQGRRAVEDVAALALRARAGGTTINGPVQNIAGRDVKHVTTGDVKQGKGGRIG